jgi:hypothetical protein
MAVTMHDDDLQRAIVDAYAHERFAVPLDEVQPVRRWRPMWISAAAIATAAAVLVGFVLVNGARRDETAPVSPAAPSYSPRDNRWLMPPLTDAHVEAECRTAGLAALARDPVVPASSKGKLPPLRVGSAKFVVGGVFIFADDRVMVECVRYGARGLNVSVRDISDGSAPWLNADAMLYETYTDTEIGWTLLVGWVPASATGIHLGGMSWIEKVPGADFATAALFVVAFPEVDVNDLTLVVDLPDRVIARFGDMPPVRVAWRVATPEPSQASSGP